MSAEGPAEWKVPGTDPGEKHTQIPRTITQPWAGPEQDRLPGGWIGSPVLQRGTIGSWAPESWSRERPRGFYSKSLTLPVQKLSPPNIRANIKVSYRYSVPASGAVLTQLTYYRIGFINRNDDNIIPSSGP